MPLAYWKTLRKSNRATFYSGYHIPHSRSSSLRKKSLGTVSTRREPINRGCRSNINREFREQETKSRIVIKGGCNIENPGVSDFHSRSCCSNVSRYPAAVRGPRLKSIALFRGNASGMADPRSYRRSTPQAPTSLPRCATKRDTFY